MSSEPQADGPSDDAFVARVRDVLDAGDAALDDRVRAELAAARRNAVNALDVRRPSTIGRWIPASAAACTLIAVGMFSWSVRLPTLPVYDDAEAAEAAQELDLLDDIEFVAWMVEQEGDDAA
jgi:hypothetical protein